MAQYTRRQFYINTLKMGMESVPETLENCHTLPQLSAREDFIEFCRREKLQDFCTNSAVCIWSLAT